jgi:hypothetical protein
MLTMAVEEPPVRQRGTFVDGVLLFAATTVLVGSVVGLVYFALIVAADHALFDEWQVIFVAAMLGAVLVGLGLGSWYVLRGRFRRDRPRHRMLAILACVPGLFAGGLAAVVVLGALTQSWVRHSSFGNPDGPGVVTLTSAPAPLPLASRMLAPNDLGVGWYPKAKPNPSLMLMTSQASSEGQIVSAKDFIDSDHWTGTLWRNDGTVIEVLRQFDSVTDAQQYPATWKAQNPGVVLAPQTVGQTVVLEGMVASDWRFALFTVGDTYFEVQEDNIDSTPTAAQFRVIVDAAVARATASP